MAQDVLSQQPDFTDAVDHRDADVVDAQAADRDALAWHGLALRFTTRGAERGGIAFRQTRGAGDARVDRNRGRAGVDHEGNRVAVDGAFDKIVAVTRARNDNFQRAVIRHRHFRDLRRGQRIHAEIGDDNKRYPE